MNEETGWVCTEPEPTADTHRTVRIWATMEISLCEDINVPKHIDDDEIYNFLAEGGIDGDDMVVDHDPLNGEWTWKDVHSVNKFDPTATDYSTEILES